jgi:serine protease Do
VGLLGLSVLPASLLAADPAATPAGPVHDVSSGLKLLEQIQDVITDLAERARPSVVNIFPVQASSGALDQGRERQPGATGSGAGVIIDRQGHIVTNNHVVGDAAEVEVRFSDRTKAIAQVVGRDQDTDLAVLKLAVPRDLPYANFGDSSTVRVGQWVLAVGNPFGLERTVTLGVVSGVGRENINLSRYENFIQTDASINPGNSGGPLFNLRGEVIGINTAIINFAQGIGFAIPSNMAKQVVQQLLTRGRVVRAWLGVGIQPLTAELAKKFGVTETDGVLVNEVFDGDPAAASGIHPGDVITKINRTAIDSPNRLSRVVATLDPGSTAKVEIIRDGHRREIEVALSERRDGAVLASVPQVHADGKLGLDVQDLTAALAEKFKLKETHGVLVSKVDRGTLAHAEGLREGDLIKEVNRTEVNSVGEFTAAVARARRGESLLLRVIRESRAFYVVLKTG